MYDVAHLAAKAACLRAAAEPFAVATVVRTDGSTYRQLGARMLILEDGSTLGLISGGCLEEEIAREAELVMASGTAVLRSYGLEDTENIAGFGTGCNGRVDVLITCGGEALAQLETPLAQRTAGVLAQCFGGSMPLGRFHWFDGAYNSTTDHSQDDPFPDPVRQAVSTVLGSQRSKVMQLPGLDILIEYVQPPVRLVICGSGPDVQPLVHLAKVLGWPVVVVSHRPVTRLEAQFPEASEHVFLMHASQIRRHVALDSRTAVVIMNHHLERDRMMLAQLLNSEAGYLGILGPRARTDELMAEARHHGAHADALDRVFGPAGLDTGAETPEEIALAICTEILTAMNGRKGRFLRDGKGAIHAW